MAASPDASVLCRQLPKAELHAHLHGSIRPSTLIELVRESAHLSSNADAQDVIATVLPSTIRSLRDCFRIFDLIHQVVRTEDVVRRVTSEVVADFAADGVDYLELRTTPRVLDGGPAGEDADASLERYLFAVLETLALNESQGGITCRLLLSINRTATLDMADRTVRLACKFQNTLFAVTSAGVSACTGATLPVGTSVFGPFVVGVDLSGDPTRGSAVAFFPALGVARAAGLRIAIHAGEVMNVSETEAILDWRPDRLGHMCVLAPSAAARLVGTGGAGSMPDHRAIPIETCPTSNALTLHLPSLGHHPMLSSWLAAGYPVAVCTDDSGVFDVTLSSELRLVAEACHLGPRAVADLALAAFRFAFLDPVTRDRLTAAAESKARRLLESWDT